MALILGRNDCLNVAGSSLFPVYSAQRGISPFVTKTTPNSVKMQRSAPILSPRCDTSPDMLTRPPPKSGVGAFVELDE
jgi:hypothetical protein